MTETTDEIPIDLLTLDDEVQGRAEIDQELVDEYAWKMENGTIFPPLEVYLDAETNESFTIQDETFYVADGFHRVLAAQKVGRTIFRCKLYRDT